MQAEFNRTRTKSTTETVEYEVQQGVESVLGAASEPLDLDMASLPQGQALCACQSLPSKSQRQERASKHHGISEFEVSIDGVSFVGGLPMSDAPATAPTPNQTSNALFPPVLKSQVASSVILRYVDGITRRINKVTEARLSC